MLNWLLKGCWLRHKFRDKLNQEGLPSTGAALVECENCGTVGIVRISMPVLKYMLERSDDN